MERKMPRTCPGLAVCGIIEARHQVYMLHPAQTLHENQAPTTAAASMFSLGTSAFASSRRRRPSPSASITSLVQQQNADSVGARQRGRPLFTVGGMEVRVWAPVAPPYNDGTYGDMR